MHDKNLQLKYHIVVHRKLSNTWKTILELEDILSPQPTPTSHISPVTSYQVRGFMLNLITQKMCINYVSTSVLPLRMGFPMKSSANTQPTLQRSTDTP